MIAEHTNRIADALASSRRTVREQGRLSWEVQPDAPGRAVILRASDDDWLLLDAPLDASACATAVAGIFLPEKLLRWNATLPGGARFAVDAQFNLSVRAEVSLIEDLDPGPRAIEALDGVLAGLARFGGADSGHLPSPSTATAIDLLALAGETTWAFTERDDGRVTFDLPSPVGVLTATLHGLDGGGVRVWVPLAELADLTTLSRHAFAVLFLRAGFVLRLVRPAFVAADTDAAALTACFEVVFATTPAGAELTQALESLAVGVALVAAEANLLCEEQTAREYLTAGNWIPQEQPNNNNNTNKRTQ